MPVATCEVEGLSVVLVGNLNPAIFQPTWLARHNLVGEQEAAEAEIQLIRPELTAFTVGPFRVQVELERGVFEVLNPGLGGALLDLVTGTFTILAETPISQMGINRTMHFRMPSVKSWHAIGHRLAPKDFWARRLQDPGMRQLIVWGKREGSDAERLQVSVEPSAKIQPGVFIGTNEHFELAESHTGDIMKLLRRHFEPAIAFARDLANEITNIGLESAS